MELSGPPLRGPRPRRHHHHQPAEVHNAFRGRPATSWCSAFARAGYDQQVGAIVLTGAGERAFCTGGDQSAHDGQYDGRRGVIGMPIDEVHSAIRDVPKPVIAKVRGYAIGGGNVLARSATSPSPPRPRSSARSARRWARSIPASAPPISPA